MLIRCFSPWFVSQTGVLEIKPNRKARKGNARKGRKGDSRPGFMSNGSCATNHGVGSFIIGSGR